MGIISTISNLKKYQESSTVTPSNDDSESASKSFDGTKFVDFLKGFLTPNAANQVSEEELFSAIVRERLVDLKGDTAGATWDSAFATQKALLQKPDGFVPLEDAATNTLRTLVGSGDLTEEEANDLYQTSFAAAQLDNNVSALWDNRGGPNDTTIALATMESALEAARLMIDKFVSGSEKPDSPALYGDSIDTSGDTITPTGTTVDGADGFLFKPISVNQGTLAILMPEALAYQVESVFLKDLNGNTLDEGQSTGYGDTGERQKFSFSKKGEEYPKDLRVEVKLTNGTTRVYEIPDPSLRYD